jgi:hypothetical protein
MEDRVLFPLYVCLDDGTFERIESFDRILYRLEVIDIENDEYMFWDAASNGVKILIGKGKVSGFEKTDNKVTLQQAFAGYAQQLAELGATVDVSGAPEEIWSKVQMAKASLPRRPGFFASLFRRTKK